MLGPILGAGALLRLAICLAIHPISYGLNDSGTYMAAASGAAPRLFYDVHHPVGYSMYLAVVSPIVRSGTGLAILQHLLGLAAVALLYFAGRGFGAPRWASGVAAGAYALSIDVVALEHSVLSEAIYMPLIALFLFAASRIYQGRRWRTTVLWAAILGVAAAASYTARYPGAALFVVAPLAAAALTKGKLKFHLGTAAATSLAIVLVVGSYLGAQNHQMGIGWQLFPGKGWNDYAAIAPRADCSRFTPPPGTRVLCQTAAQRRGQTDEFYVWSPLSPGRKLDPRGFPYSDSKFEAFATAASASLPNQRHGPLGALGAHFTTDFRRLATIFGPLGWAPPLDFRNLGVEPNERVLAKGLLHMAPMSFHAPLQPLKDLRPLLRVSGPLALVSLVLLLCAIPRLGLGRAIFALAMLGVIWAWVQAGTLPRYAVPIYELSLALFPLAVVGLIGMRGPAMQSEARAHPATDTEHQHRANGGRMRPTVGVDRGD